VALGYCQLDALVIAKSYVNQGLRLAPGLGFGKGPLAHLNWPENEIDLPWLTKTASEGRHRLQFPSCGPEKLGFYPIVDDYSWMEKLLPLGVTTIQLRIKNLPMEEVDEQIRKASILARQYRCRLFVNDYWQSAIKHQSYGVHLGQDDLKTADLGAIEKAGLRLGVSTHCYREVARALALRPTYLAIGPIHATTTKEMKFAPQGVEAFRRWRRSLDYPLVAIGGIFYENASELIEAGADSVAVVRDIVRATDLKARVSLWHDLFKNTAAKSVPEMVEVG
jgi:hydroxymethylpyrimidine kinase/phosphomethylpyrimidine kinase/thiamine-phosphate diphosphorylase